MTGPSKAEFAPLLLEWNNTHNHRTMPWKGEKDPYRIWLSEIILQQTRVDQGLQYYERFVQTFPTVRQLAAAPDEKVMKLWEGLGYYTRARNLLATARFIAGELNGKFPSTYDGIRALKGVGPYTAAAIGSFAFNLPHAVVDGNVFRVLARVFGIATPTDSTAGKKFFTQLANELLDKTQPGVYNQAIMDFGATVCKPVAPACSQCCFQQRCVAFRQQRINELPVKEKKISIRKRWFYYLVLEYRGSVAIRRRTARDIWQDLYEFPLVETEKETPVPAILQEAETAGLLQPGKYEQVAASALAKQQLSHQLIGGRFIRLRIQKKPAIKELVWVAPGELATYAFPRFINEYLHSGAMVQGLF